MTPWRFWLPFLVPALVAASAARGELWGFTAILGLIVGATAFDGVRILTGRRWKIVCRRSQDVAEFPARFWVPVQIGLLAWAMKVATTTELTGLQFTGLVWSTGLTSAVIGISAAHELMHRRSRFDRFLAEVLMTTVSYPHFCSSHRRIHHRWVATLRDPASARFGESYYSFLVRSVWGGLQQAYGAGQWDSATGRARSRFTLFLRSDLRRHAMLGAVALLAVAGMFGIRGLALFAFQSAIAVAYLEATNYVQHYGLRRLIGRDGRLPPCRSWHSWDAPAGPADCLTFNLGAHGSHHAGERDDWAGDGAVLPVRNLLPANYVAMATLALFPPLWFHAMDRRVLRWHACVGLLQKEQALRAPSECPPPQSAPAIVIRS